jgi:hypothetical protein
MNIDAPIGTREVSAESRPARGIWVCDDVLFQPEDYRTAALRSSFETVHIGPAAFHGIGPAGQPDLVCWIGAYFPALTPKITFFRKSPAGQAEPHYIHSDLEMGDWTGILYLNPHTAEGDGTTFWRHKASGRLATTTTGREDAFAPEWAEWRDQSLWEPWHTVPARFNRLLLFPSPLFHSRALEANYGVGDEARLIQVCFGSGALPMEGDV